VQVECQVEVRRAQAFAAFYNPGNAMLSSKRKLFAELGRVAAKFSLTDRLTASRCWVNARGRAEDSSVENQHIFWRLGCDTGRTCDKFAGSLRLPGPVKSLSTLQKSPRLIPNGVSAGKIRQCPAPAFQIPQQQHVIYILN
jgi:hypothetical protein